MGAKYELESQQGILASRLNQPCSASGKVIVLGQTLGWPVVHYNHRLGWVDEANTLALDWQDAFRTYRSQGAVLVALTFDPSVPPSARMTYLPLIETLPILVHESGPWYRRNQH